MAPDLLLLSSSGVHGYAPFEHALTVMAEIVGDAKALHFAPFAVRDHDLYAAWVQKLLTRLDVPVVSLHAVPDSREAVEAAEVLFIGGGNSFRLLTALWRLDLVEPIRRRVLAGNLRYVGSSAGTNMACPSLRTSNDMPIVQPPTYEAIGLVPFQVNPHYQDPDPASTHRGVSRRERRGGRRPARGCLAPPSRLVAPIGRRRWRPSVPARLGPSGVSARRGPFVVARRRAPVRHPGVTRGLLDRLAEHPQSHSSTARPSAASTPLPSASTNSGLTSASINRSPSSRTIRENATIASASTSTSQRGRPRNPVSNGKL
jgi:dipeptidase E